MSRYFQDICDAAFAPVPKSINIVGIQRDVYVRRLSAKDRLSLLPTDRIQVGQGASQSISMKDVVEKNNLLIKLAIVESNGKPVFKDLKEVADLPDILNAALLRVANEVNKEEDEAGKPESEGPSNDS